MTITELVDRSWRQAEDAGFHDRAGTTFGDRIAFIHTEASEAFEAFRDGMSTNENAYLESGKPVGVPSELADIVIRVADLCGVYDVDLERAVLEKLDYNLTRGYRHGEKRKI